MKRIDTATRAIDLFGPGKDGFKDGDLANGVAPTDFNAAWVNNVQEELASVVEAAGLVLDGATRNQALQALTQLFSPVVGTVRNLRASVPAVSASATFTADELIVSTAIGGRPRRLAAFNKTINLATVGAGGMDTGAAPASGYVAIYAIYNPTTGASNLLATNATAAVAPEVYGGANMPAGYTASALISVWPTNASSQFTIGFQQDREVLLASVVSNNYSAALTNTAITLAVPKNAKTALLAVTQTTATAASSYALGLSSSSPTNGGTATLTQTLGSANLSSLTTNGRVILLTPQTIYGTWTVLGGSSPTLSLAISSYTI